MPGAHIPIHKRRVLLRGSGLKTNIAIKNPIVAQSSSIPQSVINRPQVTGSVNFGLTRKPQNIKLINKF